MGLVTSFWGRAKKLVVSAWDVVSSPFRRSSSIVIADTTAAPIAKGEPITGSPSPSQPTSPAIPDVSPSPTQEPDSDAPSVGEPPKQPDKAVIYDPDFFREGGSIPDEMVSSVPVSAVNVRQVDPIGGMRWNYRVKIIVEKQIGSYLDGKPLLGPVEEWRSVLSENPLNNRQILDRAMQVTFVEDLPGTAILRSKMIAIEEIDIVFYGGKPKAA